MSIQETTPVNPSTATIAGLILLGHVPENGDNKHMDRQTGRMILESRYALLQAYRSESDKVQAFWDLFQTVYYRGLVQNTWTGEIHHGECGIPQGKPKTPDMLINELEEVFGIVSRMPKEVYLRKLAHQLHHSTFSPAREYLRSGRGDRRLPTLTPETWEPWQDLAKTLFGTENTLSQTKLTRWLVGAVARVMEPGCKMDSALVIRGKQGIGKTSMLAALFGDLFNTIHSHQGTTEHQRLLQSSWCGELGELEATFRTKDISALKAFLSETHDTYRDLYAQAPEKRPRHAVFCGTTNESSFLNDPTGSRRFWVIDADDHKIPVDWVKANRDNIWAVALYLYDQGTQWWLTPEEAGLSEATNQSFQADNPLQEVMDPVLARLEKSYESIAISASVVMSGILGVKPEGHSKIKRTVASALESLGYVKSRQRFEGIRQWVYTRPDATDPTFVSLKMAEDAMYTSGR